MPGPSCSAFFSELFFFFCSLPTTIRTLHARKYHFPYGNSRELKARPLRATGVVECQSRSSTFLSFEPANPIAHQRQLHPRKSDRQFVIRWQFVSLNIIAAYRVALTYSLLNLAPNFDTIRSDVRSRK